MQRKFTDIADFSPTVFREDVYLCDHLGEIISSRHGNNPKIPNPLSLLSRDDLHFIKDNMSFPGTRPLMLVDSSAGPIIFDLSLCPRYSLLIGIVPHITKEELLSLYKSGELARLNLSDEMKNLASGTFSSEISTSALEFANRLSSVHRYTEYAKFILQTNSDVIEEITDIAHSFGTFYGCKINVFYDPITNAMEFANEICFESCSFTLASLLFLARNFSASREADLLLHFDPYGIYFDLSFDIAEQFLKTDLRLEAPELKYFTRRASEMFLVHFYEQRERCFRMRVLPWLRKPDSADLKDIKERFIYDC